MFDHVKVKMNVELCPEFWDSTKLNQKAGGVW